MDVSGGPPESEPSRPGYPADKKHPPFLGSPYGLRRSPTVGSQEGVVSYERCTPVPPSRGGAPPLGTSSQPTSIHIGNLAHTEAHPLRTLQGYLAHKKSRPSRTLQ